MKKFILNNTLVIVGVFVGSLAGFLYWKFVGCANGTCAITSSPINSTIYGALMGGLGFSFFQKDKKSKT